MRRREHGHARPRNGFRQRCLLGVAVAVAGLASVPVAAGGLRAAASTATVRTNNVLPGLSVATKLGPAPSDQLMRVDIGLNRPDPSGEAAAYRAMYDPSSSSYHQFLTPAQFDAAFGVPATQTKELTDWLSGGGLDVIYTSGPGDVVEASGTVAQMSALFQTAISSYSYRGISFLANDTAPAVPADLPVITVVGLNTLQHFTTTLGQANEGHTKTASSPASKTAVCEPAINCYIFGYTPEQMWKLYDMPASDEGQGQTMGIFMEGITDSVVANLRVFEQRNGLSRVPVTVVPAPQPNQASSPTDNSGELEWDLDSDSSTGVAPLADRLYYYDANSLYDADVEAEFSTWESDPNGPEQMNASFGECETNPGNAVTGSSIIDPPGVIGLPFGEGAGNNLEPLAENTLAAAAMEGRTLFASAGDTGGSCPIVVAPIIGAGNGVANQGFPLQNYPCASDFAVCVGGTVLYANEDANGNPTTRNVEYAWTFGGGGNSAGIGEPDYQSTYLGSTPGTAGDAPDALLTPCAYNGPAGGTPNTGVPPLCRGTPDIAALSGDVVSNGYDTNFDMEPSQSGGTSLSSPLSMGMWTRIQAAAPLDHGVPAGLGFANETIYKVGTDSGTDKGGVTNAFYDVTTDCAPNTTNPPACNPSGAPPSCNVQRCAQAGWDETTGFGVFDVANFIKIADSNTNAVPTDPLAQTTVPDEPTDTSVACEDLFTTYSGNATDPVLSTQNDANLDITAGSMGLSSDGHTLIVELAGPALAPGSPTPAAEDPAALDGENFSMLWTYNGVTYYAQAAESAGGTTTFTDGYMQFEAPTTINTITGNFTGGVLTFDVPLADMDINPATLAPTGAAPALGSVLMYPYGLTQAVNNPALLPFTVDTGGSQRDYTVGQACNGSTAPVLTAPATVVPEVPFVPAILIIGLGAGYVRVRRQRGRAVMA